jgi:hypothetical protein
MEGLVMGEYLLICLVGVAALAAIGGWAWLIWALGRMGDDKKKWTRKSKEKEPK